MSAFDDEFGLFGDDDAPTEEERKPTLGARKIASSETIIDDIEPEDERPARRRGGGGGGGGAPMERRGPRGADHGPRTSGDPAVSQARAAELLRFLAQKLVSKPDEVIVEVVEGSRGPVIELEVHPDDFGKVIGKAGRVAQALRTIVRATAEGRVSVDIVDVEDDEEFEQDLEHAGDTAAPHSEAEALAAGAITADDAPVAIGADEETDDEPEAVAANDETDAAAAPASGATKKAPARKKRASTAGTRKKKKS